MTGDALAAIVQELPERVARYRRARGLSLRQVEAESGVSFSTVARIENGMICNITNVIRLLTWLEGGQS